MRGMAADPLLETPSGAPRARSLGIPFGGEPGPWNAITDVAGVEVGFATLIEGDAVRTGATAIHPRGRADRGDPCAAGVHVQNGNGEMTGAAWIAESGTMSGPIVLTSTHSIGAAHEGVVRWIAEHHDEPDDAWFLPVVAETYDGWLNDAMGLHVRPEHVLDALGAARRGPLEEGSVGGGTGMNAYGYKAGTGTASRVIAHRGEHLTVGVLVQANFGRRRHLTVAGVPLGETFTDDDPLGDAWSLPPGAGSIIGVVVTDAPLIPDQCAALARRMPIGVARTGTTVSHSSGDLFLALSTANERAFTPGALPRRDRAAYDALRFVPWGAIDPLFEAVVQATEEAIVDAMVAAEEMLGRDGHRSPGLPRQRVADVMRERRRV